MAKIVFLGDSLTWGGYGGDFVVEVAERMPEHTIINAGVGGDTVINLRRRVDGVIASHQPDYLFVMVGGNDATSYHMPLTRGYYKKAKELPDGFVSPEVYEATYEELLHQIQLAYVVPFVGLAPTEYSRTLVEARHAYNELAREVAESLNIAVLDLDRYFTPLNPIERDAVDIRFIQDIGSRAASGWSDFYTERDKWGYTYTFDGMHILPETAAQFADHIVTFLNEHI